MLALLTGGKLSMPERGGFGGGASGAGGFGGRGMGMGGGFGGMGGNRSAMSNGGGRSGMGFGGRGMSMGTEGIQQQYPNQESPNQQSPDQQQNPNQMGGNGGGMTGPGIGFGGPMLLGEGVKRILKHVSTPPRCSIPNHGKRTDMKMKHVLYLLIVNMPTDEEMAIATRVMEQAQQQAA